MTPDELYSDPNGLARYYSHFDVTSRVLLSGHSHQAWPDVALRGQQQAFHDAARWVDDKWQHAFARADDVRRGYASLIGCDSDEITLAGATHELVVRLLSALPLGHRPRIVTTTGEFHTIRRQLARMEEDGLEVVRVALDPLDSLAERVAAEVDDRTAGAFVSSVLFESARIVPNLRAVQDACDRNGAVFLVDAYHQLNVVPMFVPEDGLDGAFVTGGGYKYCQLGEGCGFLRVPEGWEHLRPSITGWFAEFGVVIDAASGTADPARDGVAYASGPDRFAGATYDPTSHYRASEVFRFFREMSLTPRLLREVSQHQVGLLIREFDALDLDASLIARDRNTSLERIGGFLALRSAHAGSLKSALKERGVYTDSRGDILRLGPAPYLSDRQIRDGVAALGEAVQALG
jgi:kynureninase